MQRLTCALLLQVLLSPLFGHNANAQDAKVPPSFDSRVFDISWAPSSDRIEADIRRLAGFGTRSTFSDTVSDSRGIGAARRWIKREFEAISQACGGCLEVSYQRTLTPAEGNARIPNDTWIVNVIAVQRGTRYPNRYVVMSGDIDSRASDVTDGITDAPGANDNASGMAGTIEAARVLTKYSFPTSIAYLGLSGEEQGLYGGRNLAPRLREAGWDIIAVLNNDMIGNVEGIDGVVDNTTFRVFSEPVPATDSLRQFQRRRLYGGEVDGPSRQLARYVDRITDLYFVDQNLDAVMIYRLDRFGRGGHHRPFNDAGFPGVRIMETHENYRRQHQNVRTEGGIAYGDVVDGVDFNYAARLTAVNAATLASLAWAPPQPEHVRIGGAVQPSTTLAWSSNDDPDLAGYRVYWRDTTAPQWQYSRFVGKTSQYTLKNIVIDNYLFGVAAVGSNGNESVVAFPEDLIR